MQRWEVSSSGNFLPPPSQIPLSPIVILSLILRLQWGTSHPSTLLLSSGERSPWSLPIFLYLNWIISSSNWLLGPRLPHTFNITLWLFFAYLGSKIESFKTSRCGVIMLSSSTKQLNFFFLKSPIR